MSELDPSLPQPLTSRLYKYLTQHFLKGCVKGQINSLWKKRDNVARIKEYQQALVSGHCHLESLTALQTRRMKELGIDVGEFAYVPKRPPKEIRLSVRQLKRLLELGGACPEEMQPLPKEKKLK